MFGELLIVEGAVDNNPVEEVLGMELMMMEQQQQQQQQMLMQQQQAAERARQDQIRQQQALEAARLEQIRQQQLAEQRRMEAENQRRAYQGYMTQGLAFMQNNQFEHAVAQFNLALQISQNDIHARFNIACCHEQTNDVLGAYQMFLQLSNHAAELPGFAAHLGNCESILTNAALGHMQQASQYYQAGSTNQAANELNMVRTLAPNSQTGRSIHQQADDLTNRMHWDSMRGGVHVSFVAGKTALDNRVYDTAVQKLTACQTDLSKYAAFLDLEDKAIKDELPGLLTQANRGVAFLRNVELQNVINSKLPLLKLALAPFNTNAAINLLQEMIDLANQITMTDDVVNLGYVPLPILKQSLTDLRAWQSDFNSRQISNGAAAARSVHNNFPGLSNADSNFLLDTLMNLIRNQWTALDRRNLDNLTSALRDAVAQQIEANDFCTKCCTGADRYIVDQQVLATAIHDIIAANLPQEPREPINLAMFPQEQNQQDLMLSGGIPVATVVTAVPSAPTMQRGYDEDEQAQKRGYPSNTNL